MSKGKEELKMLIEFHDENIPSELADCLIKIIVEQMIKDAKRNYKQYQNSDGT
ncbi:MAG: hypothetical protein K0S18_1226 [Anaerocolumna sp.]|jgi:hypothetical protein|nr:hypothetical protein [Anaerocolumna sp.]